LSNNGERLSGFPLQRCDSKSACGACNQSANRNYSFVAAQAIKDLLVFR
jgi:hypothetical protein